VDPRLVVLPLVLARAVAEIAATRTVTVTSASFFVFMVPPSSLAGRMQINSHQCKTLSLPSQAGRSSFCTDVHIMENGEGAQLLPGGRHFLNISLMAGAGGAG
jgi:hypothetical protein